MKEEFKSKARTSESIDRLISPSSIHISQRKEECIGFAKEHRTPDIDQQLDSQHPSRAAPDRHP